MRGRTASLPREGGEGGILRRKKKPVPKLLSKQAERGGQETSMTWREDFSFLQRGQKAFEREGQILVHCTREKSTHLAHLKKKGQAPGGAARTTIPTKKKKQNKKPQTHAGRMFTSS